MDYHWAEGVSADTLEGIVDGLLSEMTFEDMRTRVWDSIYSDLLQLEYSEVEHLINEFELEPTELEQMVDVDEDE